MFAGRKCAARCLLPGVVAQSPNSTVQASGFRLQAASIKLQAPSSKLQAPSFKLQAPSSRPVLIPVTPTRRARLRALLIGSGPIRPAIVGAGVVIALGFAFTGPDPVAVAAPAPDHGAAMRTRITRAPALGRFAVASVLLRRLDGTVDGGRTVNGPGGATADSSAVRLGPWLFQDNLGHPRREAPWGIVLRPANPILILNEGVVMPPALSGFRFSPFIGGVDYSDPLGINLPLVWVQGFEDHALTDHYHVRDFASRDGAPFARISPDLVGGLERISARIGPVTVISGYRHPAYNRLRRVGGAVFSRHQAGQAADVWSGSRSPIEIVRTAIQTMGCGIGVGLGPNSVHIDVRGALSTWTYRGAALSEAAFDLWVHSLCRGQVPAYALLAAETRWLAAGEDREELSALLEGPPPEAVVAAADSAAIADPAAVLSQHGESFRAFARSASAIDGAGVVVADLRDFNALRAGPEGRMRFVRGASPEATFLGARALLQWAAQPERAGRYLVYVMQLPGRTALGVLPLEGAIAPPVAPSPETPAAPARPPAQSAWAIVLQSTTRRAEANTALNRWRESLAGAGLPVALQVDGSAGGTRYRVTAGAFPSAADAESARQAHAGVLPANTRVLQLGR